MFDDDALVKRLAETIAWCGEQAEGMQGRGAFRTLDLLPASLWNGEALDLRGLESHPAEMIGVVDAVAYERSRRLRLQDRYPAAGMPDLAAGRLLLSEPQASIPDGVSEIESGGFFDVCDVPPWDTWVCYLMDEVDYERDYLAERQRDDPSSWRPPLYESFILSWVPPQLLDLATAGIEINAYGCILWAGDYRPHHHTMPAFIHDLRSAGLLE